MNKISNHLKITKERSNGENSMWRTFGVNQTGTAPEPSSIEQKLDYLIQRTRLDFMASRSFLDYLSPKIVSILRNGAIDSLGELTVKTEDELLKYVGIGKKELNEIRYVLSKYGLSLGMKHQ